MDDGVQFARAMRMKKSGNSQYKDGADLPRADYPSYINGLTTLPDQTNEDVSQNAVTRRQSAIDNILNANDQMHDEIQQDPNVDTKTPLDILIPKMASGTASPEEAAHFRKLIGTKLGTNL